MDKIFYWISYALMGTLAFITNNFHRRLKEVEENQHSLEVNLSDKYVKREDLRDFRDEIMGALDRIYDKLDDKQDKK